MIKIKLLLVAVLGLSVVQLAWSALPENNQIASTLKAKLSDKILTQAEITQGANQTQMLYQYCIQDTVEKLKMMYPDVDQNTVINTVNGSCVYSEDHFNLYSVLLAASSMQKPMSEKQAAVFIEKNYAKDGRDQNNAAQRKNIYKKLGLLE
ncbi:hypothetical protein [Acinetobacter sp. NIPH 2100]|uniref:hypothetical protein n=1 Tax=Acinetobacter sp. NIPH 2100 TaxID=1217708 RepID=UPI0002D11179|nr:hypothetical protein [Acinetobacter sp. NIPH 2100]ENX38375.1 hypothetical protein F887_03544 [Acinetobacter sp. NIPH 2100]